MFRLNLLTSEKSLFDGEVNYLSVPGSLGNMGILTDHAPLISCMEPGKLEYEKSDGKRVVFSIAGGMFEIKANKAVVLADTCEDPAQIDTARAESAAGRARERLRTAHRDPSIDVMRAEVALARALNRLKLSARA